MSDCFRMPSCRTAARTRPDGVAGQDEPRGKKLARSASTARDILGGNGLLLENHVARHLTDMEVCTPTRAPTTSRRCSWVGTSPASRPSPDPHARRRTRAECHMNQCRARPRRDTAGSWPVHDRGMRRHGHGIRRTSAGSLRRSLLGLSLAVAHLPCRVLDRGRSSRGPQIHRSPGSASTSWVRARRTSAETSRPARTTSSRTIDFREAESGSPIIADAVAWIDCELESITEAGDHYIVLARVRRLDMEACIVAAAVLPRRLRPLRPALVDGGQQRTVVGQLRDVDLVRAEIESLVADLPGTRCNASALVEDEIVVLASAGVLDASRPVRRRAAAVHASVGRVFAAWSDGNRVDDWRCCCSSFSVLQRRCVWSLAIVTSWTRSRRREAAQRVVGDARPTSKRRGELGEPVAQRLGRPIGRPKAWRSFAYSSVRSNATSMAPTAPSAISRRSHWKLAMISLKPSCSLAEQVLVGHEHVVEGDGAVSDACRPSFSIRGRRALALVDDQEADAVVAALLGRLDRGDDEVGAHAVGDEHLRAVDDPAAVDAWRAS